VISVGEFSTVVAIFKMLNLQWKPLLLIFSSLSFAYAQIYLYNVSSTAPGLSSTCIQVINQAVNCNSSLIWAGQNGRFEDDTTLAGLCTSTCTSALSTWQRRVSGACGTQRAPIKDGYLVLAEYLTEIWIERYNQVCLVNG